MSVLWVTPRKKEVMRSHNKGQWIHNCTNEVKRFEQMKKREKTVSLDASHCQLLKIHKIDDINRHIEKKGDEKTVVKKWRWRRKKKKKLAFSVELHVQTRWKSPSCDICICIFVWLFLLLNDSSKKQLVCSLSFSLIPVGIEGVESLAWIATGRQS
jgi:hypothetical protein